jgi:hypothetical protein
MIFSSVSVWQSNHGIVNINTTTGRFIYGEERMKMTKKARLIEKLNALSAGEKREITGFFTKYPNYENHIDWNTTGLAYQDFEQVFALAENSSRSIKRKAKTDPRLLFEKYNCEIIRQTEDFLIAVPLDWECAVFFDSFDCGGKGARWCIGDYDDASQWNYYLAKKNVFFLIFFVNKHPVFGRKVIVQYHVKNDKYTLWLQNNIRRYRALNILNTLNISTEIFQKNAGWLLGKICHKSYILNGSVLIKCYDCEAIDIPAGITTIGAGAFEKCKNLKAISIPAGVTTIERVAFIWCESLTAITMPAGLTTIGSCAFLMCKSLTTIDIPNSVTTIGNSAFWGCEGLTTINIPDSVTIIENDVFLCCEKLCSITVEKQNLRFSDIDGVLFDKIEKRILYYPAGKRDVCYVIPAGVITIGDSAFSDCKNLVTINIPESVIAIGKYVFSGCDNLKEIYLSRKILTSIDTFKHTEANIFYTD